jgi:hypothetical protein
MLNQKKAESSGFASWLPPFMGLSAPPAPATKPPSGFIHENGSLKRELLEDLSRAGFPMTIDREVVDSQVDISEALANYSEPSSLGVLAELLGCSAGEITAMDADTLKGVLNQLVRWSLYNVRMRDPKSPLAPTIVHTPMQVLHLRAVSADSPKRTTMDAVTGVFGAKSSRGTAVVPLNPLMLPPLSLLLSVPGYAARSRDGTLLLFLHQIAAHACTPARVSARSVESTKSVLAAAGERDVARLDLWFPHGTRGGFYNLGLSAWLEQRAAWISKPPGYRHPPYPPSVYSDDLVDELTDTTREVSLPGPVRLPDMIEMLVTAWDPVSDEDSDPDW